MADEITINLRFDVEKNYLRFKEETGNFSVTMTGSNATGGVQSIGTVAHEALPVTDISTPGYAFFRNTSTAGDISIGIDAAGTFHPTAKLKPGESAVMRLAAAPYAKATVAGFLQFYILAD